MHWVGCGNETVRYSTVKRRRWQTLPIVAPYPALPGRVADLPDRVAKLPVPFGPCFAAGHRSRSGSDSIDLQRVLGNHDGAQVIDPRLDIDFKTAPSPLDRLAGDLD